MFVCFLLFVCLCFFVFFVCWFVGLCLLLQRVEGRPERRSVEIQSRVALFVCVCVCLFVCLSLLVCVCYCRGWSGRPERRSVEIQSRLGERGGKKSSLCHYPARSSANTKIGHKKLGENKTNASSFKDRS